MSKDIWNEFAKSYDQVLKNWSLYQALRDGVLNYLQNANKILDQGCGTGIIAIPLAKAGKEVQGIDINSQMLAVAKNNTPKKLRKRLKFQRGDALNLKFEDCSFDGIVSNNVIFYVNDPKRLLQEAYRTLKPSGRLVIAGPKPAYVNEPEGIAGLIKHITAEFQDKGIYDDLQKNLDHFITCSVQLQKEGVFNTYEVKDLTTLLKSTGFTRIVSTNSKIYLGLCYQVVAEK